MDNYISETINQTVRGNELYYGGTRLNSSRNSKKRNFITIVTSKELHFYADFKYISFITGKHLLKVIES